jgi:hypothetical protein
MSIYHRRCSAWRVLDGARLAAVLEPDHSDVRPLVGHDLSPLLRGDALAEQPLFFMTDDEISEGQGHRRSRDKGPVVQPNHIETVVATLADSSGSGVWKCSRYFDNPDFWTAPNESGGGDATVVRTEPLPDEIELYDLTNDPFEQRNLAHPAHRTPASQAVEAEIRGILDQQRAAKRLHH